MPGYIDADNNCADHDRAQHGHADKDRRRSPRFSCGGQVKISQLPSDGTFLSGLVRDLSLGGCWIDTALPIACGARAEMIVQVNTASFRVVGEVREIRGQSGAGIEFVHLSAGGKDVLGDLVAELARLEAIMNKLKSERIEMDAESLGKHMGDEEFLAAMLSGRIPLLGTTLPAAGLEKHSGSEESASAGKVSIRGERPLVIPVNLFG